LFLFEDLSVHSLISHSLLLFFCSNISVKAAVNSICLQTCVSFFVTFILGVTLSSGLLNFFFNTTRKNFKFFFLRKIFSLKLLYPCQYFNELPVRLANTCFSVFKILSLIINACRCVMNVIVVGYSSESLPLNNATTPFFESFFTTGFKTLKNNIVRVHGDLMFYIFNRKSILSMSLPLLSVLVHSWTLEV
jgi:hypothetical protein